MLVTLLDHAVLVQMAIDDQPNPTEYHYSQLQDWLKDTQGGASDLRGFGSDTWLPFEKGGRRLKDLVVLLSSSSRSDPTRRLGSWILGVIIRLFPFVKIKVIATLGLVQVAGMLTGTVRYLIV